jgi:hypothetical protein
MKRQQVAATTLGILVVAALFATACGSDHQSRRDRNGDLIDHDSPLDPINVPEQCAVSANCEDGDRCTENRCIAFGCVAIPIPSAECCAATVLFEEDFDGAVHPGLELTALNDEAGWNVVDDEHTPSAPNALYFGDPVARTYDKGVQVAGSVTLPPLKLPRDKEAVLSLRLFAKIEPTLEYDLFWIEADVTYDTTVTETVRLFSKRDLPYTAFLDYALIDVSLAGLSGREVVLRLRFDTLDGRSNAFEGVYVDDLRVEALCPIPVSCVEDADCDSGDQCVASACSDIGCVATDICVDQEPTPCGGPDSPLDCCIADADCDDGDPRTLDVCDGATCAHSPNPDACSDDASCDDGEACTVDRCQEDSATCSHTGTIGEGCCVPGTAPIASFDNESLQGIFVTDNLETGIFWRPDKTRSTSGEFSLYCGDPVAQTYAAGVRVKSSATTRPLAIPKGGITTLELDLYKATRTAKNWDVFQVFALRDGALFPLWSSRDLADGTTANAWQHLSISLGAYAGSDLQLRFVFDSVDALNAPFEGTYLDTLELVTRCQ